MNEYSAKAMKKYEGQIVEVLVEGKVKRHDDVLAGYTSRNKLSKLCRPKRYIGKLVKVKITEAKS